MEITRHERDGIVELAVSGRLDAYWADHLSRAIDEALREGADRLRLEMSAVSYMSSVGIRVLLRFYKQLQRLGGSFSVSNPSPAVKSVLELAGLEALLGALPAPRAAGAPVARRVEIGGLQVDVFDLAKGAVLRCACIGEPERLLRGGFRADQCRRVSVGESVLAVGLGAFGSDFEDCYGRFGELLAVGGGAAYQPTDGTNVPDYLLATGAFVPELQMLYGLVCDGPFAHLARFDTSLDDRLPLSALAHACLEIAEADAVAIAVVAESAGLLGAALRRSPGAPPAPGAEFAFDVERLRHWLSFCPERVHARSLALVAGVVARREIPLLAPFLRPVGGGGGPAAHLHAAAFSYSPLRKGLIDMKSTVAGLFERERLQAVLHLLNDDREIVGSGESQFARGACWFGPIDVREAT